MTYMTPAQRLVSPERALIAGIAKRLTDAELRESIEEAWYTLNRWTGDNAVYQRRVDRYQALACELDTRATLDRIKAEQAVTLC